MPAVEVRGRLYHDGAPYAYVTLDALVVKCREGGCTVNVHAVGVNKRNCVACAGATYQRPLR